MICQTLSISQQKKGIPVAWKINETSPLAAPAYCHARVFREEVEAYLCKVLALHMNGTILFEVDSEKLQMHTINNMTKQ